EEENISRAIDEFQKLKLIDEIIVIDNNSRDQTSKISKAKKVKGVLEKKQGYGFALRRGLEEAKGDYVVLCEPDNTFNATDIKKLLSHMDKFDMVTGTRTNSKFIERGANMKGLLRFGNIFLAKF